MSLQTDSQLCNPICFSTLLPYLLSVCNYVSLWIQAAKSLTPMVIEHLLLKIGTLYLVFRFLKLLVFVFSSKIWFRAARAIVSWQEHLLMHFLGFWVTLSHLGGDILRQLIFLNPIAMVLYEKLTSLQYVKQGMRDTLLEDVVDSMNCHQCALFVVWP